LSTTTINARVQDFLTGMALPEVDVSICAAPDGDCANPVAGPARTDADGMVTLQVANKNPAWGFTGYAQIVSAHVAEPEIVPELFYWGFPLSEAELNLTQQTWGTWQLQVSTPRFRDRLYVQFNVPQDETRGTVALAVGDCLHYVSPDVSVTIEPNDGVRTVYGFDQSASETSLASAFVFFFNVPAGTARITATPRALGRAAGTMVVTVRPATITSLVWLPTPD
jgi:hypothetical protein